MCSSAWAGGPDERGSDNVDLEAAGLQLALVTGGRLTNLKGGLPIIVSSQVLGAVGVSSGSGEEDLEVAKAGVAAIPGAKTDW